jgi:hypothetical protein
MGIGLQKHLSSSESLALRILCKISVEFSESRTASPLGAVGGTAGELGKTSQVSLGFDGLESEASLVATMVHGGQIPLGIASGGPAKTLICQPSTIQLSLGQLSLGQIWLGELFEGKLPEGLSFD